MLIYQDGGRGHLGFSKFQFFNGQEGRTVPACQISSKSLEPHWDITMFRFFQDGGRPPSWICNACVGTTHEGHSVVFITVQNLVGIDAVVLIICTFSDFASLAWKCLFTPIIRGFYGENMGRCGAILTPNELVLTFGGLHVCVQFGEDRRRNATVRVSTDRHTHTHTHTHTRAHTHGRKTILLSVPCYYAIAMGQIIIITRCRPDGT